MGSGRKVVIYSGTKSVYYDMAAACNSLLYHTPEIDQVYLLTEDDKFPYRVLYPDKVKVMNVSGQKYFTPDSPNYNRRWSYMILLRSVYTELFPDEDLVLSMDIDTIVKHDISNIWLYDMQDYFLGGVREPIKSHKYGSLYINFGVVLMNLDLLRKSGIDRKAKELLQTKPYGLPEQDVFFQLCKGRIKELPSWWNTSVVSYNNQDPYIYHYAGETKKKELKEIQRMFII